MLFPRCRFACQLLLLIALVPAAIAPTTTGHAQELTGAAFSKALEQQISIVRGEVELLEMLERLQAEQQVAMLLDRRIDPQTPVIAELRRQRLEAAFGQLASQAGGGLSIVSDTVYVGPLETVRTMRTLIELRQNELLDQKDLGARAFQLTGRRRIAWPDLTEPSRLVSDIARQYQLTVSGLDLIPHDLWRGGHIAHANAAEALLILLLQFDLSFEWLPNATGIQITPVPEQVALARLHTPKGMSLEAAATLASDAFPTAQVSREGTKLLVSATLEEHEALAILLGEKAAPGQLPRRGPVNLARQRFSLRLEQQPASQLIAALQRDGVTIEYDTEALTQAGINLDQRISIELQQATIQQLMHAICEPLRMTYKIVGNHVVLTAGDE